MLRADDARCIDDGADGNAFPEDAGALQAAMPASAARAKTRFNVDFTIVSSI